MKYFTVILIIIGLTGCAKQYTPLRSKCLPEPILEQVLVQGGTIDKENTIHVINNHVKAWEYIEYLRVKGCR